MNHSPHQDGRHGNCIADNGGEVANREARRAFLPSWQTRGGMDCDGEDARRPQNDFDGHAWIK